MIANKLGAGRVYGSPSSSSRPRTAGLTTRHQPVNAAACRRLSARCLALPLAASPPLLNLPSPPHLLHQFLSPRWLGEEAHEAEELAALLHEAAPKLALANLRPPVGAGVRPLLKNRSYEVSDTVRDRLRAAVAMPMGQ